MKNQKNRYILPLLIGLIILGGFTYYVLRKVFVPTIKVGILHSLTGTMALSELNVVTTTLMAIEDINRAGGVLGRQIESVIADGRSDLPTFAKRAEELITKDKVAVIFGCWTSASRKEVKPIVEKHNNLLFYPVQYEGIEQSPNIIYTGAIPNQQIIPGVNWCRTDIFDIRIVGRVCHALANL